jgi:hypothetical protein
MRREEASISEDAKDNVDQERQQQADNDGRDQGEVEGHIALPEDEIPRQPPQERHFLRDDKTYSQQQNDDADYDEDFSYALHDTILIPRAVLGFGLSRSLISGLSETSWDNACSAPATPLKVSSSVSS